jgi:hypothetical protein
MKNLTHPTYGISLAVPENWSEISNPNLIFLVLAPEAEGVPFRTNVNLIGEDAGKATLDQLRLKTGMALRSQLIAFQLEVDEPYAYNDLVGRHFIYTHDFEGVRIKVAYWMILFEGAVYHLTGSSNINQYNQHASQFNEIAKSLEFL